MKRENEYEKTGYKKETGSEEYQKNGKKQNEYCEQNIVDQILRNTAIRKKKSIISMGFLSPPHSWVIKSKRSISARTRSDL